MSVADVAAQVTPLANAHNVLILDIERMKGTFRWEHYRGFVIEGEFWDLGDYRKTLGRIPADAVTAWPRNITAAWNWYHTDRVEFAAEWDKGGPDAMHRRIWDLYDKAQIVIGHNIDGFDTKKLKTAWAQMGLTPPSPFKSVDTLKVARREFGAESNTLDALCKRFGIVAKTDRYDHEVARAACAGNRAAQRQLKGYNIGDIPATKGLYDFERPWHASHPHSTEAIGDGRLTCNSCWRDDLLTPNGYKLANQILYRLYRCTSCGANVQGTRHSRAAMTRGAR